MSQKSEEKRYRRTEGGSPTPTRAIDTLIRDEEQTGKKEEKQKERNRELASNPSSLDYSVVSYDPQGSYGGPILKF